VLPFGLGTKDQALGRRGCAYTTTIHKDIKYMILTINSGSSSIKFTLFPIGSELQRGTVLCRGQISGLGDDAQFVAMDSSGHRIATERLETGANHRHELVSDAELFGSDSFLILLANSFHAVNEAGQAHVRGRLKSRHLG
jgi:hypothetical protein